MKTRFLSVALLIALALAGAGFGQESKGYYWHEVTVVDDEGRVVTDIN